MLARIKPTVIEGRVSPLGESHRSLEMSENQNVQPRALAPRKLEQVETLQSLNHWRTVVRNYFRRCQYYSYFLAPDIKWDNTVNCNTLESALPARSTPIKILNVTLSTTY